MSQARRDDDLFKRWKRAGRAVQYLSFCLEGERDISVELSGLTIRAPKEEGGEILVVLRGLDEEGAAVVAFHSAFSLDEALVGVENRLANGSLKWRIDEWANR